MPINTDHIDMPVSFDLGELSMPLSDISTLAPGRVFELRQEVADATVNVRLHGKLIAQGTLVAIGRRLGVRLTRVNQLQGQPDTCGDAAD